MTTLQSEDCQTNDPNDLFPMSIESLALPLDNSMRIVFTGYYNGFNVEVRSTEEMGLLYHMGCFGKGSASRSKPMNHRDDNTSQILRRRQYLKRNYWFKKFSAPEDTTESDTFLQEIDELTAKIVSDAETQAEKDVIDLVSSEEENNDGVEDTNNPKKDKAYHTQNKGDIVVIVPNSDSEDDNYFCNLRTKCCINKIRIKEKLILTLQEAFFLTYGLGCLQVVNADNILSIEQCWQLFIMTDKRFLQKYVVYHYFRSKGYVVKPGIKFGGDYLLYKEGPGICHADYIVLIKYDNMHDEWVSILSHVRMANTTVKTGEHNGMPDIALQFMVLLNFATVDERLYHLLSGKRHARLTIHCNKNIQLANIEIIYGELSIFWTVAMLFIAKIILEKQDYTRLSLHCI